MNENMDNRQENKIYLHDSKTTELESSAGVDRVTEELSNKVTNFSNQISTEETETSLADMSAHAELSVEANTKSGVGRTVSTCSQTSVAEEQPKPPCAMLETCTVYEGSHSFTSISKTQESFQTMKVHPKAEEEDLCAAILLACLFCHPLDCLLATMRACSQCAWSLCSSLCGCESTALQPLVNFTQHCDLCGCLGVRCLLTDCPICDICLQATECLDLAMEVSQMLYH